MKNVVFILTLVVSIAMPLCMSAQLSENVIEELAKRQVDKLSQYISLSKFRKVKLMEVWKKHEQNKSEILRFTNDISGRLHGEKITFFSSLSKILTPKELELYKTLESLRIEDDREYLASLVEAISTDSLFLEAYTDLQYKEIFPFKMSIRMEMEETMSTPDKIILKSIRTEVLEHYDKCLLTCLVKDHNQPDIFENFNELIIVALNKDLNDSQSGLSQLIKLTHKYEEAIHDVYIKHEKKFNFWNVKTKELKEQYILNSYNKSLLDLRKRNGLSTLNHLESEAIFLLLDPYDHNVSRKLFNLDLYSRL